MFQFSKVIIILCVFLECVSSLRLEDAEEGSCRGIRYKALPHVDLDFMDSLHYIAAGNRYHIYRHASAHPRFREMREFELYYSACLTQNTSVAIGDGTAFGFGGRSLGSFTKRSRIENPSILDTAPIVGPYDHSRLDRMQQHITLTDHRTFVFLANCWVGSDQRSWDVYSLTTDLSPLAKRMIEEHAVALGFKRDQIVFLNYNSCEKDPYPDKPESGGEQPAVGLGWKSIYSGRNPVMSYPGMVQFPNTDVSGFVSGKIVSSRATINPSLGNNSLRRANSVTGGLGSSRLSLASSMGVGWSR